MIVVDKVISKLQDFLYGNTWIQGEVVSIYVRKSNRPLGGKLIKALDIANITVSLEYQNRGIGTEILNLSHEYNPFRVTYIENVLNPRFYEYLVKNDWTYVPRTIPPCVFRLKEPT